MDQHCDTAKGNLLLSRNPADPTHNVQALVHFDTTGRITSPNVTFDHELNSVLNLNAAYLKNARIQVLRAFQKTLLKHGSLTKKQLLKKFEDWAGVTHTNELRPYCGVVVYWTQKALARR